LSAAKSFVEESAEREELEQLTDRQLLRRAAREVAIAVCWSPKPWHALASPFWTFHP
jgi:hypothetical protein